MSKPKIPDLCGELMASLKVPRLEDENAALTKRVAELESKRRHVMCAYCGESFYEYPAGAPTPEAHEAALCAFVEHDATCERNPLAKRVAELEAETERLRNVARDAFREREVAESVAQGRLKRVAELESQVTEQRAVPIPMGLGEVCVSECHDGDGVLREMVIHARRSESQPVGTPLPDGYVGLPLPNGEILARIRIENADGARMVLLDSLERCINAAYVADGKAPMPTRADLQSQLAWTPVAQGLPTEHADYEFTYCDSEQVSRLDLVGLTHEGFSLVLSGDTFAPDELLDNVDYTHFRRITLPEAT